MKNNNLSFILVIGGLALLLFGIGSVMWTTTGVDPKDENKTLKWAGIISGVLGITAIGFGIKINKE